MNVKSKISKSDRSMICTSKKSCICLENLKGVAQKIGLPGSTEFWDVSAVNHFFKLELSSFVSK